LNGPNTIDSCVDGSAGSYTTDESVEDITVKASDAAQGGVLRTGGMAGIVAQVYSYAGEQNKVDFFYSSNPGSNPNWQYISTAETSSQGLVILNSEVFPLSTSGTQAVRVSIRWTGENSAKTPCPTSSSGSYSDVDDLVFVVDTTAPVTNKASYDAFLKAPKCGVVHSSGTCTTLGTVPPLLIKKTVSGELNGPNTIDSCVDGSAGSYTTDESVEDITVKASDAAQGGVLRTGGMAGIVAQVYSYAGEQNKVDFFYSSNPGSNPNWQYISTAETSSQGLVILNSEVFPLSTSGTQAVRVSIRWTGENSAKTPCPTSSSGSYSDVDDLVFVVKTSASVLPVVGALPALVDFVEEEGIPLYDCATLSDERCEKAFLCELVSSSNVATFFGESNLGKKKCSPKSNW